jgi:hypothetical protein
VEKTEQGLAWGQVSFERVCRDFGAFREIDT